VRALRGGLDLGAQEAVELLLHEYEADAGAADDAAAHCHSAGRVPLQECNGVSMGLRAT
jgi:hypothetical protein